MSLQAHFDTTHLPRLERYRAEVRAKTQDDQVLRWFRAHPGCWYSREELEAAFNYPPQVASRVLRNLTARGALEKSESAHALSRYRRRCHTWRLAGPMPVEQGRLL